MDIKRVTKRTPFQPTEAPREPFRVPRPQENLFLTQNPPSLPPKPPIRQRSWSRFFFRFGLVVFLFLLSAALAYGVFFVYRINRLSQKINPSGSRATSLLETVKNIATENYPDLRSENGRINVLLLGIAGEKKPGQNLTDTIMILSIDTADKKVALFSLPRDMFVEIPDSTSYSKINSVYQIGLNSNNKDTGKGVELIEKAIENITDLKMDYYAILNFDGFEKIIDSIGGVNIMNERDIYDARYPGPNYSYETFSLSKGFHHLDGATALRYVRERHDDPEGDFGRAKRQQQVMQATKNKIFSAETLLNVFALGKLMDALGNNLKTDISPDEIGSFLELSRKLDTQNVANVVVDAWTKESLLKVAHVDMGGVSAFVLVPRVGNYSEIQEAAGNIFHLDEIKRRKDEIQKENARITLVNLSGNANLSLRVRQALLDHLDYKNIDEVFPRSESLREKTRVFDLTEKSKPFTLDELIKTLPAELSSDNQSLSYLSDRSGNQADIVVELGKDLIEKYNIEEGTIEDWQKSQEDF